MSLRRLELRITGLVQGVFYRASTRDRAEALGLTGWVANRADGSVALVAEGEASLLDQLARWCEQGPPGARVAAVERRPGEATGEFVGFLITR